MSIINVEVEVEVVSNTKDSAHGLEFFCAAAEAAPQNYTFRRRKPPSWPPPVGADSAVHAERSGTSPAAADVAPPAAAVLSFACMVCTIARSAASSAVKAATSA